MASRPRPWPRTTCGPRVSALADCRACASRRGTGDCDASIGLGALLTLIGGRGARVPAVRRVQGEPHRARRAARAARRAAALGGRLGCHAVLIAGCRRPRLFVTQPARAAMRRRLLASPSSRSPSAAAADALTPPGNQVFRVAPGGGFWRARARARAARDRRVDAAAARTAAARAVPGRFHRRSHRGAGVRLLRRSLGHARIRRECDALCARGPAAPAAWHSARSRPPCSSRCRSALCAIAQPRLRAGVLGALNFVQTIPSIALFGILMAPLAALAAALPALAATRCQRYRRGPGRDRAVPLFAAADRRQHGRRVWRASSPAAVDAARGMGLTDVAGAAPDRVAAGLADDPDRHPHRARAEHRLVTIAALIGGGGLGAFVFQGIGQTAIDLVLLGAIPTVALAFSAAVVLDALTDLTRRVSR